MAKPKSNEFCTAKRRLLGLNPGPLHTACGILAGEEMLRAISTLSVISTNIIPSAKFRVSCGLC